MTDHEREVFDSFRDSVKILLRDVPLDILMRMVRVRTVAVLARDRLCSVHEFLDDPERGPILWRDFELMVQDPERPMAQAARALWAATEAEP